MSASPAFSRGRPAVDDRRAEQIVQDLLERRPGYLPDWQSGARGPDSAILWVFARYLEAVLQRLDQAPDKNRLAFLDLLGVDLIPARPARAPVVFRLADDAAPTFAAAGTQVVAPPPPESQDRIIFETERRVGLSPAKLLEVYSLWPGRDAYIDHSAAVAAGQPFTAFRRKDLQNTPHHIYLAHDTLLALAGEVRLHLHFELTQASSEHLNIRWEYWDGKVWRPFKGQEPGCEEQSEDNPDGTFGLTRSGTILLTSDCAESEKLAVNGHLAYWVRGVLNEPLPPDPAQILPVIEAVRISTEIVQLDPALAQAGLADQAGQLVEKGGLALLVQSAVGPAADPQDWLEPDTALFNVLKVDTSQTFYPLGQSPNPGDVFYIAQEEILSKPGAQVFIDVRLAPTPAGKYSLTNCTPLQPELKWEYWNGRRWTDLGVSDLGGAKKLPSNFLNDGQFTFTVPDDLEPVTVNDQEGLWIRAYLAKESYGCFATVTWNDGDGIELVLAEAGGGAATGNTFTYVIPQPPALLSLRMGYIWQHGPYFPEKAFSYNDFQYRDDTEAARWPGQTFAPYSLLSDTTPALYLGFDQQPPVDRLNLFFDITEQFGDIEGPELVWEFWDGFAWQHLQVEDETNRLRVPGMLSWTGSPDSQPWARFSASLHWLRGRLKEDGPPGEPVIAAIYPNAVWASHRQTVVDDPLGESTGQPDQAFTFRQAPVLPDEIIEVRELSGPRAQVEWRLLALEVLGDDHREASYADIQDIEDELRREGTSADIQRGILRLKRDRLKRVTEAWVTWERRDHFLASGPDDRHYQLERSRGRLTFGDGEHGKVPPPAAAVQARRFQTGGGRAGNVTAGTIQQLLGGIGGVEQVFNPRPAEGGADAESLTQLARRGPFTLRHHDRALAPVDYETLAREASPAVAVAQALPNRDPEGRLRPGWITLIIIPNSETARPWPSFGLREAVRRYIAARAPACLADSDGLFVTGPRYQPVDVRAVIAPRDPAEAGAVEAAARTALLAFFHPLFGGPERRGWSPGRAVYLSDVAALLERVPGVDFVAELALLIAGGLQGDHARIPGGYLAVAGDLKIQMEMRS